MADTSNGITENNKPKAPGRSAAAAQSGLTPLMQQYSSIKAGHPGTILFFRLGDFYEMFGEDAVTASAILDVVLTKRQSVPMCGIPYHAANAYIKKLIKAGKNVAVCEQLEDPASPSGRPGTGKGIVKRGVVRVITPGTLIEDSLLESRSNNYLVSLFPSEKGDIFGLAAVDISTGQFLAAQVQRDKLRSELFRINPGEIVVPDNFAKDPYFSAMCLGLNISSAPVDGWHYALPEAYAKVTAFFKLQSLKPLGIEDKPLAVSACGGALAYLKKTGSESAPLVFSGIKYYSCDDYLLLDENAIKTLEIIEGSSGRGRENSLLESVDMTLTPMGGRALRQWLTKPLLARDKIEQRHRAVELFVEDGILRRGVRETLKGVCDIERVLSRLASFAASPRELMALNNSLFLLEKVSVEIQKQKSILSETGRVSEIAGLIKPPKEVCEVISRSIADEPPAALKDGGVIREGFVKELDELRTISRESKKLISDMEQSERKRTGINSLKIGYNSVFGYFIEVSKANLHLISPDYIRKQTVTNGERFITPELKEFEGKVLSAEEKISALEEAAFKSVCRDIMAFSVQLQEVANNAAELDIYASFAETAVLRDYSKPEIDDSLDLEIKDGRHPVVEAKIKSGSFVSNDIYLNGQSDRIMLLTGPNMSGKSTYLRQTALIVILAQAGSYVPCAKARLGVIDRIFTRIGAGDNLSAGESTFMVEMHETANILNQHTHRSLIILDEVGRGTSTYDGISIAWASVEHLSGLGAKNGGGPKVLFATHYFELTELEGKLSGVKNYNVSVKEWQGEVVFLHKILPGAADRSYGIHVAKLAGLPETVIKRAYGILAALESKPVAVTEKPGSQLDFFALPSPNFMVELDSIDVDSLTPLEALQTLARWKKEANKA